MFIITFEDETHIRWSYEYVFEDIEDAKGYLKGTGFIEKNRLFIREDYVWSKFLKAYITPLKVYKNK